MAKSVKKKAPAARGVEREGSARRKVEKLAFEGKRAVGDGGKEHGKGLGKGPVEDSTFGLAWIGRPWSFAAGGAGHTRERSEAPPALPVPIASFTI